MKRSWNKILQGISLTRFQRSVPAIHTKEATQATLTAKGRQGWQFDVTCMLRTCYLGEIGAQKRKKDRTLRAKKETNVRLHFCPCQGKCTTLCTNSHALY